MALGAHTPYYRFLFQSFGDVFRAIRAPSRGIVLFHLALAVLAAWGLALLAAGTRRRDGASPGPAPPSWSSCSSTARSRSASSRRRPQPPPVYAWLASLEMPGAVVEWPFGLVYDFDYVFRQAAHGKPILNGYSGFFPATYTSLEAQLKQRPIPDSVWAAMGDLGAAMLVYHAHEGAGFLVLAYADALDRALAQGRLELVRSFPHGAGLDFVLMSPATAWPDRARRGAAAPEETRRLYAAATADLRRNVARLAAPFGAIHLPKEGQEVAPGFWVHGWALDDSGIAEVRFAAEQGPSGLAMLAGAGRDSPRPSPTIRTPARAAATDFRCPSCPTGRTRCASPLVGRDGGVTTLERAIVVDHRVATP